MLSAVKRLARRLNVRFSFTFIVGRGFAIACGEDAPSHLLHLLNQPNNLPLRHSPPLRGSPANPPDAKRKPPTHYR